MSRPSVSRHSVSLSSSHDEQARLERMCVDSTGQWLPRERMAEAIKWFKRMHGEMVVSFNVRAFNLPNHDKSVFHPTRRSDPYFKVVQDGTTLFKSRAMKNTLQPEWKKPCRIPVVHLDLEDPQKYITVEIYDRDLFSSDFIGKRDFTVAELFTLSFDPANIDEGLKLKCAGEHPRFIRGEDSKFARLQILCMEFSLDHGGGLGGVNPSISTPKEASTATSIRGIHLSTRDLVSPLKDLPSKMFPGDQLMVKFECENLPEEGFGPPGTFLNCHIELWQNGQPLLVHSKNIMGSKPVWTVSMYPDTTVDLKRDIIVSLWHVPPEKSDKRKSNDKKQATADAKRSGERGPTPTAINELVGFGSVRIVPDEEHRVQLITRDGNPTTGPFGKVTTVTVSSAGAQHLSFLNSEVDILKCYKELQERWEKEGCRVGLKMRIGVEDAHINPGKGKDIFFNMRQDGANVYTSITRNAGKLVFWPTTKLKLSSLEWDRPIIFSVFQSDNRTRKATLLGGFTTSMQELLALPASPIFNMQIRLQRPDGYCGTFLFFEKMFPFKISVGAGLATPTPQRMQTLQKRFVSWDSKDYLNEYARAILVNFCRRCVRNRRKRLLEQEREERWLRLSVAIMAKSMKDSQIDKSKTTDFRKSTIKNSVKHMRGVAKRRERGARKGKASDYKSIKEMKLEDDFLDTLFKRCKVESDKQRRAVASANVGREDLASILDEEEADTISVFWTRLRQGNMRWLFSAVVDAIVIQFALGKSSRDELTRALAKAGAIYCQRMGMNGQEINRRAMLKNLDRHCLFDLEANKTLPLASRIFGELKTTLTGLYERSDFSTRKEFKNWQDDEAKRLGDIIKTVNSMSRNVDEEIRKALQLASEEKSTNVKLSQTAAKKKQSGGFFSFLATCCGAGEDIPDVEPKNRMEKKAKETKSARKVRTGSDNKVARNIAEQLAILERMEDDGKSYKLPSDAELTECIPKHDISEYKRAFKVLVSHVMTSCGDDLTPGAELILRAYADTYQISKIEYSTELLTAYTNGFSPTNVRKLEYILNRLWEVSECVRDDEILPAPIVQECARSINIFEALLTIYLAQYQEIYTIRPYTSHSASMEDIKDTGLIKTLKNLGKYDRAQSTLARQLYGQATEALEISMKIWKKARNVGRALIESQEGALTLRSMSFGTSSLFILSERSEGGDGKFTRKSTTIDEPAHGLENIWRYGELPHQYFEIKRKHGSAQELYYLPQRDVSRRKKLITDGMWKVTVDETFRFRMDGEIMISERKGADGQWESEKIGMPSNGEGHVFLRRGNEARDGIISATLQNYGQDEKTAFDVTRLVVSSVDPAGWLRLRWSMIHDGWIEATNFLKIVYVINGLKMVANLSTPSDDSKTPDISARPAFNSSFECDVMMFVGRASNTVKTMGTVTRATINGGDVTRRVRRFVSNGLVHFWRGADLGEKLGVPTCSKQSTLKIFYMVYGVEAAIQIPLLVKTETSFFLGSDATQAIIRDDSPDDVAIFQRNLIEPSLELRWAKLVDLAAARVADFAMTLTVKGLTLVPPKGDSSDFSGVPLSVSIAVGDGMTKTKYVRPDKSRVCWFGSRVKNLSATSVISIEVYSKSGLLSGAEIVGRGLIGNHAFDKDVLCMRNEESAVISVDVKVLDAQDSKRCIGFLKCELEYSKKQKPSLQMLRDDQIDTLQELDAVLEFATNEVILDGAIEHVFRDAGLGIDIRKISKKFYIEQLRKGETYLLAAIRSITQKSNIAQLKSVYDRLKELQVELGEPILDDLDNKFYKMTEIWMLTSSQDIDDKEYLTRVLIEKMDWSKGYSESLEACVTLLSMFHAKFMHWPHNENHLEIFMGQLCKIIATFAELIDESISHDLALSVLDGKQTAIPDGVGNKIDALFHLQGLLMHSIESAINYRSQTYKCLLAGLWVRLPDENDPNSKQSVFKVDDEGQVYEGELRTTDTGPQKGSRNGLAIHIRGAKGPRSPPEQDMKLSVICQGERQALASGTSGDEQKAAPADEQKAGPARPTSSDGSAEGKAKDRTGGDGKKAGDNERDIKSTRSEKVKVIRESDYDFKFAVCKFTDIVNLLNKPRVETKDDSLSASIIAGGRSLTWSDGDRWKRVDQMHMRETILQAAFLRKFTWPFRQMIQDKLRSAFARTMKGLENQLIGALDQIGDSKEAWVTRTSIREKVEPVIAAAEAWIRKNFYNIGSDNFFNWFLGSTIDVLVGTIESKLLSAANGETKMKQTQVWAFRKALYVLVQSLEKQGMLVDDHERLFWRKDAIGYRIETIHRVLKLPSSILQFYIATNHLSRKSVWSRLKKIERNRRKYHPYLLPAVLEKLAAQK